MASVTAEVTSESLAEVEADLTRRFELVDTWRRVDDGLVMLGLVNAGRVPCATSRSRRRELCRQDPFAAVEREELDPGQLAAFQQLWYRLRVPFGAAPLYWWYLLTLALRVPGRSTAAAVEEFTALLEQVAALPAGERAACLARAHGGGSRELVVARGDLVDRAPLEEAVAREAPLVLVRHDAELAELSGDGWTVIEAGREPAGGALPGLARIAGGRPPELAGLRRRAVGAWAALGDDERTLLLCGLQQRLKALEQLRLTCGGAVLENAGVVEVMLGCRRCAPADWTYEQLCVATLARCWDRAGFIVQELNQALLTLPLIATFMSRRRSEYAAVTAQAPAPGGGDLLAAADELGRLRAAVERDHLRCIQFDGSNWERREFLVPKALREDFRQVPGSLADLLASRFDVELGDRSGSAPAWDAYLEALLERGRTPTELLCAVADWAADDDLLPVDAVIFTAPHGIKLDRPWELEIDEVFCYTAFREGFDPAEHGIPLDLTGVRNVIGQRMRYNVVKKAQNYALVKRFPPQSFNLPDIAVAEDANHAGHRAGGIRLSMRIPATIRHRGDEWKGIADVRFNRVGYRPENRFRPRDVVVGSRLVAWEKGIADAAFARDLLFERRFCRKLEGPTGVQIAP